MQLTISQKLLSRDRERAVGKEVRKDFKSESAPSMIEEGLLPMIGKSHQSPLLDLTARRGGGKEKDCPDFWPQCDCLIIISSWVSNCLPACFDIVSQALLLCLPARINN